MQSNGSSLQLPSKVPRLTTTTDNWSPHPNSKGLHNHIQKEDLHIGGCNCCKSGKLKSRTGSWKWVDVPCKFQALGRYSRWSLKHRRLCTSAFGNRWVFGWRSIAPPSHRYSTPECNTRRISRSPWQ